MAHYNEGDVKFVVQAILGVFIAYVVSRFFGQMGVNYSIIASVLAFVGFAILYFSFRKNREFDGFVGIMCLLAVPFSIMHAFVY